MKKSMLGRRSSPQARGKPSVAHENEEVALRNIRNKIRYAVNLLKRQDDKSLALLPRSLRQFNLWTSDGDPSDDAHPTLFANSPDTLRKQRELTQEVLGILETLKRSTAARKPQRPERLSNLQKEVKLEALLRGIAEKELAKERSEHQITRNSVSVLKAQASAIQEELQVLRERYDQELQALRDENAGLIRAQRKISPVIKAQ